LKCWMLKILVLLDSWKTKGHFIRLHIVAFSAHRKKISNSIPGKK
jgi:hypothetical protein